MKGHRRPGNCTLDLALSLLLQGNIEMDMKAGERKGQQVK